ncbi:MAG: M48 family metallopeptidase [Duodenibacillus sp.]|nr:M48 family metallopeptidase [Duodenibacillus sp.]
MKETDPLETFELTAGSDGPSQAAPEPIYYTVRRTGRTLLSVRITDQGVVVTAPRWVTNRAIEEFVEDKREWITTHYERWQKMRAAAGGGAEIFAEGGWLPYRGGHVTLRLGAKNTELLPGAILHLAVPSLADRTEIARAAFVFLFEKAREVVAERIELLSDRLPKPATKIALSNARRQWGSCTSEGHVYFSWRLIFFDDAVIDYVIAHEFSHRVHMNHSQAFWKQVEAIMPSYREPKDRLKSARMGYLPL